MELSKKVKIALDETRILILGAQILLGSSFAEYSVMATSNFRPMRAILTGSRWGSWSALLDY